MSIAVAPARRALRALLTVRDFLQSISPQGSDHAVAAAAVEYAIADLRAAGCVLNCGAPRGAGVDAP